MQSTRHPSSDHHLGNQIYIPYGCIQGDTTVKRQCDIEILQQLPRLYHIDRITRLVSFVRVVRGKYGRRLRRAILVEDKCKLIVAVSFALETESPLRLLERRFGPVLRRCMLLTCLGRNFLRVESRATLVS
jgi:hypothetical protein